MKRTLLIGGLILAAQLAFAGMASAATYDSSSDQTLNIDVPLSTTDTGIGTLTYDTQQALYSNVINPLGVSYNYDYYWVDVNGDPVLALDPAKIGY